MSRAPVPEYYELFFACEKASDTKYDGIKLVTQSWSLPSSHMTGCCLKFGFRRYILQTPSQEGP